MPRLCRNINLGVMNSSVVQKQPELDLLFAADLIRLEASLHLDSETQSALGQYFTPLEVAALMASMPRGNKASYRILDAGAGTGILTAACVEAICADARTRAVHAVLFEIDEKLAPYIERTMALCHARCRRADVRFTFELHTDSFIDFAAAHISLGLFTSGDVPPFDIAILNPPYKKFRSDSATRAILRRAGLETGNLYTAFVGLALTLLVEGGELISISPRSFCNGPYFRPFREHVFKHASLERIHVFDARDLAFAEDNVLQENVILHLAKRADQSEYVDISWSTGAIGSEITIRSVSFDRVVRPSDANAFIHVSPDEWADEVTNAVLSFPSSLKELGVKVSTGRVVDFRALEFLRTMPEAGTAPLLYPQHVAKGRVRWPIPGSKKPNAIALAPETLSLLIQTGHYVLVKRFTSKEEQKRIVAIVLTPDDLAGADYVGLENHFNYFHQNGRPLDASLCYGLAAYLNSTIVDSFFRQFSGHTQVNATDLRSLHYPSLEQLGALGERVRGRMLEQEEVDVLVEGLIYNSEGAMPKVAAQKRIDDACELLRLLGLPKEQLNDRSALALLALANLTPHDDWKNAESACIGVTPIMQFADRSYGVKYAPNTRETFRRFTLHQFVEAGLVVANPDKPDRPTNSPAYCYQLRPEALALIRSYGYRDFDASLSAYLREAPQLAKLYAQEREMARVPVRLSNDVLVTLSKGGQNELVVKIIEEFLPRFAPGGYVVYVGDTDNKELFFDRAYLEKLGVSIEKHGKMPDVVIHHVEKNWLLLIEAVTSHGPVNPKRRGELKGLFGKSSAGLVFVSTFLDRSAMTKYLRDIAWETEVWVAESASHIVHFNGERFLGPYDN